MFSERWKFFWGHWCFEDRKEIFSEISPDFQIGACDDLYNIKIDVS